MAQYIDKDALVAEIERQISAIDNYPKLTDTLNIQIAVLEGNKVVLTKLLSFLDTLEVKEVDFEKELDDMITPELKFHKALPSLFDVAKHFFELGIGMAVDNKAQKGEQVMTQEDKDKCTNCQFNDTRRKGLLFKDLCARVPYGVRIYIKDGSKDTSFVLRISDLNWIFEDDRIDEMYDYDGWKPYLRPMSSMIEEERIEFSKLLVKRYCEEDWEGHISTSYCIEIDNVYTDDENGIKYPSSFSMDAIDWLNAHHFDYRGLIDKGLAIEAPEGMYK